MSTSELHHHRARNAILSRHRPDDDPELDETRRDLDAARPGHAVEQLERRFAREIDTIEAQFADRLTPAQRARLAALRDDLVTSDEGGRVEIP